ncbi:MAG: hypothetical protein QOF20_1139, partial [Acidimicrobiaceae bacterium]|nr:hypothetical protein [Acidimicrobiaceae bacterium]
MSCTDLGEMSLSFPSGTATPPLPDGVQVSVAYRATDSRTGATVTGGRASGTISCDRVPFSGVRASDVIPASLPAGVAPGDKLTGSWSVSVSVAGPEAIQPALLAPNAQALTSQAFPFAATLQSFLSTRSSLASAAVFDAGTGATYSLAPQNSYVTASIVKVDILATLLRRTQVAGRGLTSSEQATAARMIEFSDNTAATALWNEVGGGPGVAQFNSLIGMANTVPGSGGLWGLTRTTVEDQVQLMRTVAYPNAVLGASQRAYLHGLMQNVTPAQRWGVSGGVPAGTTVALKNGWLPVSGGWEINSIGHIAGSGRDYVIAVLTSRNPSMGYGITTVEGLSVRIWSGITSHQVQEPILSEWNATGGGGGFLGYPTTDALPTADTLGRYQLFQGGSIYWSAATGAHEVHGGMRDEWKSLSYENGFLGYPTTDALPTADTLGRYQLFQGGSIYWSAATGAHEVHGAIR